MQKRLSITQTFPPNVARSLIEMMLAWEDEPATFQQQRREDGQVDVLMSKRTYDRAMNDLAKNVKLIKES